MSALLIRHSESEGNKLDRISPGFHSFLSDTANSYINATSSELLKMGDSFDIVVSSPAIRANETALRLFKNKSIIKYDQIRDFNFGDMADKQKSELNWKNHIEKPFNNGESVVDVYDRSLTFLKSLDKNKKVAVVTHGEIIVSILHYLNNIPLEMFPLYEVDYCGFIYIDQFKLLKTFGINKLNNLPLKDIL